MPFIEDEQDCYHQVLKRRKYATDGVKEETVIKIEFATEPLQEKAIDVELEQSERIKEWLRGNSPELDDDPVTSSPSFVKMKPQDQKDFLNKLRKNRSVAESSQAGPSSSDGLADAQGSSSTSEKPRRLGSGRPPNRKKIKCKEIEEEEKRERERKDAKFETLHGKYSELYRPYLKEFTHVKITAQAYDPIEDL